MSSFNRVEYYNYLLQQATSEMLIHSTHKKAVIRFHQLQSNKSENKSSKVLSMANKSTRQVNVLHKRQEHDDDVYQMILLTGMTAHE